MEMETGRRWSQTQREMRGPESGLDSGNGAALILWMESRDLAVDWTWK